MISVFVLSRAWHIKFKTLSIEDLIVVKTRGGLIKANVLAREDLVVGSTTLRCPLRPSVLEVVLHLVSGLSESSSASEHIRIFPQGCHFTFDCCLVGAPGSSVGVADANQLVVGLKSIGLRKENTILFGTLLFRCRQSSS